MVTGPLNSNPTNIPHLLSEIKSHKILLIGRFCEGNKSHLFFQLSVLTIFKQSKDSIKLCLYLIFRHEILYLHKIYSRTFLSKRCRSRSEATECCVFSDTRNVVKWTCSNINPLKTEQTLPHYILEESIFNFRYVRLYYVDS